MLFTKKEERVLMQKITRAVGTLLEKANTRYTDREIQELSKVPTNRLTEYKKYQKYRRSITFDNVVKLLFGGVFTMDDLKSELRCREGLTVGEENYLKKLDLFGNAEFRNQIIQNDQKGIDQIEVQRLIGELAASGIDPVEALKKLKKGG